MKTPLGATGKFPQGKLHQGDEGELQFAITRDVAGNVHIDFGKDVAWLAMSPQDAVNFARLLLKHAGATKVEVTL